MAGKMMHTIRAELSNAVRRRYSVNAGCKPQSVATGNQKRRILDEFIATTSYHGISGTVGSGPDSSHSGHPDEEDEHTFGSASLRRRDPGDS